MRSCHWKTINLSPYPFLHINHSWLVKIKRIVHITDACRQYEENRRKNTNTILFLCYKVNGHISSNLHSQLTLSLLDINFHFQIAIQTEDEADTPVVRLQNPLRKKEFGWFSFFNDQLTCCPTKIFRLSVSKTTTAPFQHFGYSTFMTCFWRVSFVSV